MYYTIVRMLCALINCQRSQNGVKTKFTTMYYSIMFVIRRFAIKPRLQIRFHLMKTNRFYTLCVTILRHLPAWQTHPCSGHSSPQRPPISALGRQRWYLRRCRRRLWRLISTQTPHEGLQVATLQRTWERGEKIFRADTYST